MADRRVKPEKSTNRTYTPRHAKPVSTPGRHVRSASTARN